MTDYIPETNDVRMNYVDGTRQLHGKNMRLEDVYSEFDRWLAEVKAQAWEEGFDAGEHDVFGRIAKVEWDKEHTCIPNPYRQGYKSILQSSPLFPEHVGEDE